MKKFTANSLILILLGISLVLGQYYHSRDSYTTPYSRNKYNSQNNRYQSPAEKSYNQAQNYGQNSRQYQKNDQANYYRQAQNQKKRAQQSQNQAYSQDLTRDTQASEYNKGNSKEVSQNYYKDRVQNDISCKNLKNFEKQIKDVYYKTIQLSQSTLQKDVSILKQAKYQLKDIIKQAVKQGIIDKEYTRYGTPHGASYGVSYGNSNQNSYSYPAQSSAQYDTYGRAYSNSRYPSFIQKRKASPRIPFLARRGKTSYKSYPFRRTTQFTQMQSKYIQSAEYEIGNICNRYYSVLSSYGQSDCNNLNILREKEAGYNYCNQPGLHIGKYIQSGYLAKPQLCHAGSTLRYLKSIYSNIHDISSGYQADYLKKQFNNLYAKRQSQCSAEKVNRKIYSSVLSKILNTASGNSNRYTENQNKYAQSNYNNDQNQKKYRLKKAHSHNNNLYKQENNQHASNYYNNKNNAQNKQNTYNTQQYPQYQPAENSYYNLLQNYNQNGASADQAVKKQSLTKSSVSKSNQNSKQAYKSSDVQKGSASQGEKSSSSYHYSGYSEYGLGLKVGFDKFANEGLTKYQPHYGQEFKYNGHKYKRGPADRKIDVLKTVSNVYNSDRCARECEDDFKCDSFGYDKSEKSCKLYPYSYMDSILAGIYAEIKSTGITGPRTNNEVLYFRTQHKLQN